MRPMIAGAEPGWANLMGKERLAPAVGELWNAWEIHSVILVSLLLQIFLFLFAGRRRHDASSFLSTVLWLAYLLADSVAVFVLGHLAVHASQPRHQLMSFWAPFVLVHLGGQDTITAFSRQDNELWGRHLLNLVTQVAIAGYVVWKASWPDCRIWAAMVLMFITGCFKYAERTLYLYFASPKFITSTTSWRLYGHGKSPYKDMKAGASKLMEKTLNKMFKGESGTRFWDSFNLTTNIMAGDAPINTVESITAAKNGKLHVMLEKFRSRQDLHRAYKHVGALLVHCYRRLYTKAYVREQCAQCSWSPQIIFYAGPTLFPYVATPIALALFAAAEKGAPLHHSTSSNRADIWVSYILLVGAVVLEASSAANFMFSRSCFNRCPLHSWCKKQWSERLGQYNMISGAKYQKNSIGRKLGWDVKRPAIAMDTKEFILDSLLDYGKRQEWHIASTRGQLALRKWTTLKALKESVRSGVDFPTSVLIWHIATDLCFSYKDATTKPDGGEAKKKKLMSMGLSNYIMYLVFKCGVMLTTNSKVVHDEVRLEIWEILSQSRRQVNRGEKDTVFMKLFPEEIKAEHEESKEQDEVIKAEHVESKEQDEEIKAGHEESKEQDEEIKAEHEEFKEQDEEKKYKDDHMKRVWESAEALYSPGLLRRASGVAQELISIKDEAKRWDLIAKVWAEMLYYTACRCGAAFHYEHLSTGGEFITHVFVLMYLLGPFMPPPGT